MELSKNKKLLLIVVSAFLVCIISTVSYAYFTATVAGNAQAQATVIQTGHMEVTYAEGNVIGTSSNMLPGNYIEKTFTVENTGTVDTSYSIYLNDVRNTFVTKSDLVYELITEDGRVVGQITCPDSNTAIATNINIPVNTTHHYTLRITFKETNLNQDDNKGKLFKARIGLVEEEATLAYTIVSGDLDTVGSVVKIADEEFYVIGQEDSTHVKLFAKYNLGVGNGFETPTNKQDVNAIGYGSVGSSPYTGTVDFSSSNYWFDGSGLDESYGSSYPAYVYGSNSNIKTYVDNYVTYLNNQGVSVTGRLISYEELVALGCDDSLGYCDSSHGATAPNWVSSTSYWVGSAASYDYVRTVHSFGDFSSNQYNNNYDNGVRPVIILEK